MNAQEMMNIDKADLVWRILTLESKIEAQNILIKDLEDGKVEFDPREIAVGSVWECIDKVVFDTHKGGKYPITQVCAVSGDVWIQDDESKNVISSDTLLKHFKRVS